MYKILLAFWILASLAFCHRSNEEVGLMEMTGFGSNPGNLQAFKYIPADAKRNAALVVVLHGCGQVAADIAAETGWNELADSLGFFVLYPQQQAINNINKCFNWFQPDDIVKGKGEALSIRQMVDAVKEQYKIDEDRIFVTGMSAGGAMTAVMLATYPEIFNGGAVIAGVPYGAASDLTSGLSALRGAVDLSAEAWEGKVREQNPSYTGPFPKVVFFHGTDDPIVNILNAREGAEQWKAVLDLEQEYTVTSNDENANIRIFAFGDPGEEPLVLRYEIDGLGHAIPVDPGNGPRQGGTLGPFAKDVDFFSTYWAARFFELVQ